MVANQLPCFTCVCYCHDLWHYLCLCFAFAFAFAFVPLLLNAVTSVYTVVACLLPAPATEITWREPARR